MYKKSVDHKQLDAFSSPIEYLKDSTMNYYHYHTKVLLKIELKKLYFFISVIYENKSA